MHIEISKYNFKHFFKDLFSKNLEIKVYEIFENKNSNIFEI